MVVYNFIQIFLIEKNLHIFTFYTKAENRLKSLWGICLAMQRDYIVSSVKQMTAECPTPEGGVTHFSLLVLRKLQTSSSWQPSVIWLKRPKTDLHNAAVVSVLVTFWCTAASLLAAVLWGWTSPSRVPRGTEHRQCLNLQDGESPHPTSYRDCSHAKQELQRRRNLGATTEGSAGRIFFSKFTAPDRSFPAALASSDRHHR
jgi:hypothetical protein